MSKYRGAIVTVVMVNFVLLMSPPVRAQARSQEMPSLEAAKLNHLAGNSEKPRFEVISIKRGPNDHSSDYKFLPGGRFRAHTSLAGLISQAYEINIDQIFAIPGFIDDKITWDIEAKPEEGKYPLTNGLLDSHMGGLMVQSVLEDAFKLKVHRETRILPGYELVIAKGGLKIKRSEEQSKSIVGAIMPGAINGNSMSLSSLAQVFTTLLKLWEGDKNRFYIVDKTGLEGLYAVKLNWTPDLSRAPGFPKEEANQSGITFFDAIHEQLGLKLTPARIPLPVVVVDDVQMPSTH